MINTRAAGDSRFARTGKDGAIYNADGVLLATVDSFTSPQAPPICRGGACGHFAQHPLKT